MHFKFVSTLVLSVFVSIGAHAAQSFYELKAKANDGSQTSMDKYKGQVALVVNTASKCGYTSQYDQLQEVYKKYGDKGFVVLGFPSNDFGSQEPGSDKEIYGFCKLNYGVTFPLFAKNPVKGHDKQPVFAHLTANAPADQKGEVKWNFEKFLVDRQGKVIARYRSAVEPSSAEVTGKIEQALAQKAN